MKNKREGRAKEFCRHSRSAVNFVDIYSVKKGLFEIHHFSVYNLSQVAFFRKRFRQRKAGLRARKIRKCYFIQSAASFA